MNWNGDTSLGQPSPRQRESDSVIYFTQEKIVNISELPKYALCYVFL